MIYKYKVRLGEKSFAKMPNIPEHCILVNDDLNNYDFDKDIKPNIDYLYYIERCADLLDIEWYELKRSNFTKTNRFEFLGGA